MIRCIPLQGIVYVVRFMTPRFQVAGAAERFFVCVAPSLLPCSSVQYHNIVLVCSAAVLLPW